MEITEGTGAGQSRLIIAYSAGKVAILDSNFTVLPDTASLYDVVAADVHVSISDNDMAEGFISTYTNTTSFRLDNTNSASTSTFYVGDVINITHGPGAGQSRYITDYTTSRIVTVDPPLKQALTVSSVWHISAASNHLDLAFTNNMTSTVVASSFAVSSQTVSVGRVGVSSFGLAVGVSSFDVGLSVYISSVRGTTVGSGDGTSSTPWGP